MSQVTTSSTHITTKVVGDQSISLANLSVLDADKLAANDPSERANLMKAAQSLGFFYLSVGSASEHVSKGLQASYEACNEYFKLPADEKMKFFRANVDRGYKTGPGHESFEIALEERPNVSLPNELAQHDKTLHEFSEVCDNLSRICLQALSSGLGLDGESDLEHKHSLQEPNDSGLKFISGPTEPSLANMPNTTHTDGGSVTLLWCEKWASQVQVPETKEWLWIEPNTQCVLVNVANYLQQQSGGRLHSPVHRISQRADGVEDRYFVQYFLRPSKLA